MTRRTMKFHRGADDWTINGQVFDPGSRSGRHRWQHRTMDHHLGLPSPFPHPQRHHSGHRPRRPSPRPQRPRLERHRLRQQRGKTPARHPLRPLPGPLRLPLPQPGTRGHGDDGQLPNQLIAGARRPLCRSPGLSDLRASMHWRMLVPEQAGGVHESREMPEMRRACRAGRQAQAARGPSRPLNPKASSWRSREEGSCPRGDRFPESTEDQRKKAVEARAWSLPICALAAGLVFTGPGPAATAAVTRPASQQAYTTFPGRLYSVAAVSADDVWAAGLSSPGGSLIVHWDGSAWSRSLIGPGYLEGVAASSATDAWAVGGTSWFSPNRTLAEHWNGKSWTRSAPRARLAAAPSTPSR